MLDKITFEEDALVFETDDGPVNVGELDDGFRAFKTQMLAALPGFLADCSCACSTRPTDMMLLWTQA